MTIAITNMLDPMPFASFAFCSFTLPDDRQKWHLLFSNVIPEACR
jgi:hypothetical protein